MPINGGWDQVLETLGTAEEETLPAMAALPAVETDREAAPDGWLMAILRQAMEELMAAEIPPLQRANAIARLSSLFLRASRASELQRVNKSLKARVTELEKRLASLEASEHSARNQVPLPQPCTSPAPMLATQAPTLSGGAPSPSPQLDWHPEPSSRTIEPPSVGARGSP